VQQFVAYKAYLLLTRAGESTLPTAEEKVQVWGRSSISRCCECSPLHIEGQHGGEAPTDPWESKRGKGPRERNEGATQTVELKKMLKQSTCFCFP